MEHVFNVLEFLGNWHVENVPREIRSQALHVASDSIVWRSLEETHDLERRATLFQQAGKPVGVSTRDKNEKSPASQ